MLPDSVPGYGSGARHRVAADPPGRGGRHAHSRWRGKRWRIVAIVAGLASVPIGGAALAHTAGGRINFQVTSPVTVQAMGLDSAKPRVGQTVTAGVKVVAERRMTLDYVVLAVRDQAGRRASFPGTADWTVGPTQRVYQASRAFDRPGRYTYWFAYRDNGRWTSLGPKRAFTVRGEGAPATPTGSPSSGPTTAAPASPSPTTGPTPTSSAGPTPAPRPSPTGAPSSTAPAPGSQVGCMSDPSRCGYPDRDNTGVPAGTSLTVRTGDLVITQPGVYERLDVRGCVDIRADNVTLRKSRVGGAGGCPHYVIRSFGRSGVLIEDVEVVLSGWETKGIAFDGYTARRVWFHGGSDCAHMSRNVVIEDSFCDIPAGGPRDGPHYDGFQSDGGSNIRIRHNTVRVPYGQTSAILMSTNTAPIRDVTVTANLLAGGGYTVYCGTSSGVVPNMTFTNNRFSRVYFPRGGYWGPTTYCERVAVNSGNVWDEGGAL